MHKLTAKPREAKKKNNKSLRKSGEIPAVLYGKKCPSQPISVSLRDFEKIWKDAGESGIIELEGLDSPKEVLVQDVAMNPVNGTLIHADFYAVEKGQKVRVSVPLEFVGTAPAAKEFGGLIIKVMHDMEVEAEPVKLPHQIEVGLSSLKDFNSQIAIRDLILPDGVEAVANPEEIVAMVSEAAEESENKEMEAPDFSQIETEQKGKEVPNESKEE